MLKLEEGLELEGYTLIVPSVSVGNVGQLAADLLVASLNLRRVGRLLDDCFIPLVGADPYDEASQDVCTAVDVYADRESRLVVVQIRSQTVSRPTDFMIEILNFVRDHKIARVIILASSFGHEKSDTQLRTPSFRYLATETALAECGKEFEKMSWIALEPKQDEFSGQPVLQINGGGFAKIFFDFLQINNVFCVVVLKFCSEGDNIPDACDLVNHFNRWLKLITVNKSNLCDLKFPPSWKCLFGNSPPRELY